MLDEEGWLYCAVFSLYEGGLPPFREEAMGAKSLFFFYGHTSVHGSAMVCRAFSRPIVF